MPATHGVIFDLDGVLTDTAELHFQSWREVTAELGIRFDRAANEALRGLGRMESLRIVLGSRWESTPADLRQIVADRKNDYYLRRVAMLSPAELLPGISALLPALRTAGAALAVASSSKNARVVLDRLGIAATFDAIIDGNDAPRSKPDPQVFLAAAAALQLAPVQCVVVEDAEAGVAGARAAGMRVIGVGPHERVGGADAVVATTGLLTADRVLSLLA